RELITEATDSMEAERTRSALAVCAQDYPLTGGDDDLGARADRRGELVPAAHGLELRGGDGARVVDLVDRRVYAPGDLFRLTPRALRYLARRHIAATAPDPRAFERVRQMNGVVPPIPFDFDGGVHLGGHDEEASGKFGH